MVALDPQIRVVSGSKSDDNAKIYSDEGKIRRLFFNVNKEENYSLK
jgi:hypothetical protein